ncbi:YqaJ viral recombinase family protein [Micrococcus luteus]|uniref:YqaJ viral recombinase family protein n=1 Tax=Micrococcus luteus TaxID=1270 RepID=UPI003D343C6C
MSPHKHPTIQPHGHPVDNAPAPGTPEWATLITASKIPAILGLSTWDSPYSLWCKATGRIDATGQETAAAMRGTALESALFTWLGSLLEDSRVRPGRTYASNIHPAWQATPDGLVFEGRRRTPYALVECKTAARADEWGKTTVEDPTAEIPPAYLAQVAWQMYVTGADLVFVPALVVMDLRLYVVRRADVEDALPGIIDAARRFEDLVATNTAPDWDGATATYEAVRAEHPDIDPDLVATIPTAHAVELHAATAAFKAAESRMNQARSVVLHGAGIAKTIHDEDGQKVATRSSKSGGRPYLTLTRNYEPAGALPAAA